MSKLRFLSSAIAVVALGCGDKKSPPANAKPTEPEAASAAVPAAAAKKLGPIDLAATTIDLAALYPGAEYVLYAGAEDDDAPLGEDTLDRAEVRRGDQRLVDVALVGNAIDTLRVFEPGVASPAGVAVGAGIADLARLLPDATCVEERFATFCSSPKDTGFRYSLDRQTDEDPGTELPIAKIDPAARIAAIEWTPPAPATIAARPTQLAGGAGASGDDIGGGADRPPTADEIDRCARLHVITSKCKLVDDPEFGWIPLRDKPVTLAQAKRDCSVVTPENPEEDYAVAPVPTYDPDKLAKVEAAAKRGCKALFAALDEVDPRITPAGDHPVDGE